ncbi:hypothetical protein [Kitasatospora sp. NPDC056184]
MAVLYAVFANPADDPQALNHLSDSVWEKVERTIAELAEEPAPV